MRGKRPPFSALRAKSLERFLDKVEIKAIQKARRGKFVSWTVVKRKLHLIEEIEAGRYDPNRFFRDLGRTPD